MSDWMIRPIVDYGFIGFSAILLGVVIWLIKKLLGVLDANNRIIAANTEAIRDLSMMTRDLLAINRSLHDKIISRPCIAHREER